MFELIRRLKLKIKKVINQEGLLVIPKFFKEFPRIAKNFSDLERIVNQGLEFQFMVDDDVDRKMSSSS